MINTPLKQNKQTDKQQKEQSKKLLWWGKKKNNPFYIYFCFIAYNTFNLYKQKSWRINNITVNQEKCSILMENSFKVSLFKVPFYS